MRTVLFLFAVLLFLAPAVSAFLKDKCSRLKGKCMNYCQKNEELVALCLKFLRCCRIIQPCMDREVNATGPEDWVPPPPHSGLFPKTHQ
ncbi:beta-defensin 106A-like [Rousettus aegyptiacus]|uniref:beta-defensin 106A-like n=1 Tax=Rousettus aegyptiacus TaxID=9407 RepID=UPI0007871F55|nr:beta-defensin 106A-like [Rousettus aegyptiacus]